MSSIPAARPLRAYRRAGKFVLEIDEPRFCADAFLQSPSRIVDRDAFLAFACDQLFELLHDDDDACQPTWWLRYTTAALDSIVMFRTLCGSASEQSVLILIRIVHLRDDFSVV